jgi:UDP-N-acetylmuramoyl-tripeptide--D-alanyl-D-alanine ligase
MLTIGEILEALTDTHPDWATHVITDAVVDSRQASPGSMFVALPGDHKDGHDFVNDAFSKGASLALIQREVSAKYPVLDLRSGIFEDPASELVLPFCLRVQDTLKSLQEAARFWRHKLDVQVIGITGSVGKTTTKEVVAEVLSRRYRTLKNPGNLNNEIGLPLTLLQLTEGHQIAVLEMGFYVLGEIEFLCNLASPMIGVVTNIGTVHAERAGSQEAIAQGKAELIQALPENGYAILNYDDPRVRAMEKQTQAKVFFYGLNPEAHLWADEVKGLGLDGIHFRMHYESESIYLKVPLIGRHSVHTALRAAAVGIVEGLTWQEIVEGLRFGHSQLRLVAVRSESGALLLDDTYNASPASTMAALNLLEELEGRKVAVLGDMLELGPYEQQGHELAGVRAAEVVDELITVGERARVIAGMARKMGMPEKKVVEFATSEIAIDYLRTTLQEGDVVLVKGSRGMKMDQIAAVLESL